MREIITNVKGLRIEGVNVRGIGTLSQRMREWISSNTRLLLESRTIPEKTASEVLESFPDKPIRQAFFIIRGRSYFLDFFFPERMLAVEIDGSSHLSRKKTDRMRDSDFRSIGIRTIRITNKDVMDGKLQERLFKRLFATQEKPKR